MNRKKSKESNSKMLTIDEVADYFSGTRWTGYNWVRDGWIDALRVGRGRLLRIRKSELAKLITEVRNS